MIGLKRLKKIRAQMKEIAVLKDGRRAPIYIGELRSSGAKVAVVVRDSEQIFRGNASTLTEALQKGTLCWMMDATMVDFMRDTYGVRYLMTLERQTGDLWVSPIEDWSDSDKLYRLEGAALLKSSYRGQANRYLPTAWHTHLPGKYDLLARGLRAK